MLNAPIKVSADTVCLQYFPPWPLLHIGVFGFGGCCIIGWAVELNQFIDGGWSRNTVSHLIY